MSINLKLDGRTGRGRCWKDLSLSGNAINQGALVSGKICSHCNQTPEADTDIIKCMKCSHMFHTTCLLKPLSENDVALLSNNPSMWWFCLNCISVKSGEAVTTSSFSNDASTPVDVMLQSTLCSFKKEMLTLCVTLLKKSSS